MLKCLLTFAFLLLVISLAGAVDPSTRIAIDYQPAPDAHGKPMRDTDGSAITAYVPENAVLDGKGMLEARADVIVRATPPVPGTWLGDLVSSNKAVRIIPAHVITGRDGLFHATLITRWPGGNADLDFGDLSVAPPKPAARAVTPAATLLAENARAVDALRRADAPLADARIVFEPTLFYKQQRDVPSRRDTIAALKAYHFAIPQIAREEFTGDVEIDDTHIQLTYHNPAIPARNQAVASPLPEDVKQTLRDSGGADALSKFMWYSERNSYVLEDGAGCLRFPAKNPAPVYTAPAATSLDAVSAFPRSGLLLALATHGSGTWLQTILLAQHRLTAEFPLPLAGVDRILWVNGRYALATGFGRRSGSYAIIDLARRKIAKSGPIAGDTDVIITGNKLFKIDTLTRAKTALFDFASGPH